MGIILITQLVRNMLATLVYLTTKIIHDAPDSYPTTLIGNGVRTLEKIFGHINSLIQLSNRFWSYDRQPSMAERRKKSARKEWEMEVHLISCVKYLITLLLCPSPRKYSPEK
jgi:hypothetical protein